MKTNSARFLTFTALFSVLTYTGSLIRIPLPPVPFTLQVLFVLLSANVLGAKGGAASQSLYLLAGLAGLPVFAYGGGPGYILHPTFGYLAGFPAAAYVAGLLSERILRSGLSEKAELIRLAGANCIGAAIILFCGVGYLMINTRYVMGVRDIEYLKILWAGLIIFVPSTIAETIMSAWLAQKMKPVTGRKVI